MDDGGEALARSEELLREAQHISHVGHWRWEVGSDTLEWLAEEVFAIHGVSPDDWDGSRERYLELVFPADRPLIDLAIQEAFSTGQSTVTHRIVRPDGEIRFVRNRCEAVYGSDGAPVRLAGTCQDITDQEKTRRALREREARFRRLFDNASDIIYRLRLEPDRGFDYLSPSVARVVGYTPVDFEDAAFLLEIVHPHDRDKLLEAVRPESPSEPHLIRFIAKDGTVVWTEHRTTPVVDEMGNVVAIEGIARDVTERIQASSAVDARVREQAAIARMGEAALSTESRDDLLRTAGELLAETLEVGAVVVYERVGDEFVARHAIRLPGAVIGMRVASPAAADTDGTVTECLSDTVLATPLFAERGLRGAMTAMIGGKDRPFGAIGAYDPEPGALTPARRRFMQAAGHMIGAAIDRIQAKELLQRSEREFRTLADNSPDIISRFDRQLRHVYVSGAVQRLVKLEPSTMIGKSNRELGFPDELVDLWETAIEEAFRTGEPSSLEFTYPGTQATMHFENRLIPEIGSTGEVESVLGVTRDVTNLRRAEEGRREALVRIVAAQEQERGRIAEDIHDDSIQIMTAAGMRLEIMKRMVDDPDALAQLERLEMTVRRSIVRLRSLMFALRPPELDREGLASALRLYLKTADVNDSLAWELTDTCERPLSPDMRVVLYRIAQEAVTNVRKHAQASWVRIALDEVDGGVRMRVEDDGIGVRTEQLSQLGSHHIGLRTMTQRAESAGGRLEIDARSGDGTVVTAWLPFDVATGSS